MLKLKSENQTTKKNKFRKILRVDFWLDIFLKDNKVFFLAQINLRKKLFIKQW